MSDNQENLEELLKSMVEVKGYKYPLSVCSFAIDCPTLLKSIH